MTKGCCMYKHLPPFQPQGDRRDGLASRLSHGLGYSCFSWELPRFPLLTENEQGGSGPQSSASQNPCFIFLVHSPLLFRTYETLHTILLTPRTALLRLLCLPNSTQKSPHLLYFPRLPWIEIDTCFSCVCLFAPPGSSVQGIFQARILERVALPFSMGSPNPGMEPTSLTSPALTGQSFTTSAIWEALCSHSTYSSLCLFSQPDHFSMLFSKPHIATKNIADAFQGLIPFLFCFVLKQLFGIQNSDLHFWQDYNVF